MTNVTRNKVVEDKIKGIIDRCREDEAKFIQTATEEEWNILFLYLKDNLVRYGYNKMHKGNTQLTDSDGITPLSDYYCDYINDILKSLRGKNGKDEKIQYCRHLCQVKDVMRYLVNDEDIDSCIEFIDGVAYIKIWMIKKDKTKE